MDLAVSVPDQLEFIYLLSKSGIMLSQSECY